MEKITLSSRVVVEFGEGTHDCVVVDGKVYLPAFSAVSASSEDADVAEVADEQPKKRATKAPAKKAPASKKEQAPAAKKRGAAKKEPEMTELDLSSDDDMMKLKKGMAIELTLLEDEEEIVLSGEVSDLNEDELFVFVLEDDSEIVEDDETIVALKAAL